MSASPARRTVGRGISAPYPSTTTLCLFAPLQHRKTNHWLTVTTARTLAGCQCQYGQPGRCQTKADNTPTRSSGRTFPGVLSNFQHLLPGTRCHKQFWSAILCQFLNIQLYFINLVVTDREKKRKLKSRLKTFLFTSAFTEHWSDLPPAPLKVRPNGAK